MIEDLREVQARTPGYPPVTVVALASVEACRKFMEPRWQDVPVIADPEKQVFTGFGRRRGNLWQLFGPRGFGAAFRAWRKGHGVGRKVGDPLVMPGVFVVQGERVLYEHRFRDVGDHPDFASLPALAGLA